MPSFLNLGCGANYSIDPCWTNVDFSSASADVLAHDLSTGIPFDDDTFDAVYHSHVLEHFSKRDAPDFIGECLRVLKPGGVLRVVVPDLEDISKTYLNLLEGSLSNNHGAQEKYEWIVVEMIDQLVRHESGGEMARYFEGGEYSQKDFVLGRIGAIGKSLDKNAGDPNVNKQQFRRLYSSSGWRRLMRVVVNQTRWSAAGLFLSGRERKALKAGLFRLSGEVHQWMYDRHSLGFLLSDAGFLHARKVSALDSSIADWPRFCLDVDSEGSEHAPASLYMEAIKRA